MKDWNPIWMLALFVAVCFLAAGAGAFFTSSPVSNWYPTLRKPTWNPPAWIFEPVWTVLFLMMAIAASGEPEHPASGAAQRNGGIRG